MTHEERSAALAFSHFYKIGPAGIRRLKKYFPDLATAFRAGVLELERAGLPESAVMEFTSWRKTFSADQAWPELDRSDIMFMADEDPEYPPLLKQIAAAPPFLYYRGSIAFDQTNRLAIVGSRRHSAYAGKIIEDFLPALAANQIGIVSGLAHGVDTLAHRASLDNGALTWAVLGSGLNNIYPRDNVRLADEIVAAGGALISEFPPATPPYKTNFPRRNRLISGLTQATLVVESGVKSGALITAAYALEQNREVLAVPGPIFSEHSAGPNNLMKEGAIPVTGAADILKIFGIDTDRMPAKNTSAAGRPEPSDVGEKMIYDIIKRAGERSENIDADEIRRASQLDMATINSKLSILELQEMIVKGGSGYRLT